jgi:integrase
MGTITSRKRKDGTVGHTALIRIVRGGALVHQEAQTFERKQAAAAWLKKRETELAEPGAIEAANRPDPTLGEIIDQYLEEKVRAHGASKRQVLRAIGTREIGRLRASDVDSVALTDYARRRIVEDKVKPATVLSDLVRLATVFKVARPAWGYPLDAQAISAAKAVCYELGMAARGAERSRVPTMAELDRLMTHFADAHRRRPWAMPMLKIVPFAIFSTRRQAEITRLRWDDLGEDDVLVTEMKHPKKKSTNHVRCHLPPEAMAIARSMPVRSEFIFPYDSHSIAKQWDKTCRWLEIDGLWFHDLRRMGVTRLFEMGWNVPRAAKVSGHRSWDQMRTYTNLQQVGDRFAGWPWLQVAIDAQLAAPRQHPRQFIRGRAIPQ